MIYGYARVSTDKQELSAEAQQADLQRWADQRSLTLDRLFVDEDVSGSKPLRDRPAGRKLWDAVTPGDMVVVTKLDRAFRSMMDAATTNDRWKTFGVRLAILDMPVDLATPAGELFFHQLSAFAQFERRIIGERIRTAVAHRRRTGKPYGRLRPIGWVQKDGQFQECHRERVIARRVLREHEDGDSYFVIACRLAREGVKKPSYVRGSGYYGISDCHYLAYAARAGFPIVRQASVPAAARAQMHSADSGDAALPTAGE